MFYKPHILQKEVLVDVKDEYGRIVSTESEWVELCRCRCDDNSTEELVSENGATYRPLYHVVCDGKPDIKHGDNCRCILLDGTIRASEGKCKRPKFLNFLNYTELWI